MARSVVITSDLSHDPGADAITFALFGNAYEIDLTAAEAKDLEALLKPYIAKARPVGHKTGKAPGRTTLPADPKAVRAWAGAHGIDCPRTGRIPRHVVEAYTAAH